MQVTLDTVEYFPAEHSVHELAPTLSPVFVIEPAAHSMQSDSAVALSTVAYLPVLQPVHESTSDAVEYCPFAHPLHCVAPAAVPALVIEPAGQVVQLSTFDAVE